MAAPHTGFVVQVATDAEFTAIVKEEAFAGDVWEVNFTDLVPGTAYWCRMKATSAYGDSDWTVLPVAVVTTP